MEGIFSGVKAKARHLGTTGAQAAVAQPWGATLGSPVNTSALLWLLPSCGHLLLGRGREKRQGLAGPLSLPGCGPPETLCLAPALSAQRMKLPSELTLEAAGELCSHPKWVTRNGEEGGWGPTSRPRAVEGGGCPARGW